MTEIADSGPSPKFRDNLLSYAFSMLYEARDIDAAVELILGMIGDHYGVSRAYVFENSADDLLCSNTHEWCAKGVAPQKDLLQNLAYADLGDFYKRCSTEGIYYCRDIDELEGTARELVKTQGIRSMLHVAIFDEHRPQGFVGFDECQGLRLWTQDEIDTLALLAKIVGIFVLKRNISARLAAAYHDIRAVLDSMAAWAYVIDENTHELLYLNEATRYFVPRARVGLKCYEAFFEGREEPCVHCPMLAMKQHDEQRATMEIENPRWIDGWRPRPRAFLGPAATRPCCCAVPTSPVSGGRTPPETEPAEPDSHRPAAGLGAAKAKANRAPSTATAPITWMAAGRPCVSAIFPKTGAKMPPTLVESPIVTPEAKPILRANRLCPRTTMELNGAYRAKPSNGNSAYAT